MATEQVPNAASFRVSIYTRPGEPATDGERDIARRLLGIMGDFAEDLASKGGAMAATFPEWDYRAWRRLEAVVGKCFCGAGPASIACPLEPWMLMYHESEDRAAF